MRLSSCVSTGLYAALFASAVRAQAPAGAIETCKNGHIALTFDDGPTQFTRTIIDLLVKYKQHATFFVNVNNFGRCGMPCML
jgi:peptidoglycan/xylan/chitin deacetylase (PgdA/CDA1 family)